MALKDRQCVTPAGIVITALLTVVVIAISAILFVCGGCGTVLTGPPLPDEPLQAPGETPPVPDVDEDGATAPQRREVSGAV